MSLLRPPLLLTTSDAKKMTPLPSMPPPPSRPRSSRLAGKRLEAESLRIRREHEDKSVEAQAAANPRSLTTIEKERVLLGLRKYGSVRIGRVHADADTKKPEEAVKALVSKMKRSQQLTTTATTTTSAGAGASDSSGSGKRFKARVQSAPIETWIGMLEGQPGDGVVPKGRVALIRNKDQLDCGSAASIHLVDWISRYEQHPDAGNDDADDQVDYGAIYAALGALMQGDVPADMNPATSQKLMQMMHRLLHTVRETRPGREAECRMLGSFQLPSAGSAGSAAVPGQEWEKITCLDGANLFGLPLSFFVEKDTNQVSDDSGPSRFVL